MRHGALRNVLATLALIGILAAPAAVEAKFWESFYDNYPDVDWLTLETEHFRIHYYPEIEWTARMMAKYAEISYPKVTGLFDYPLKERIHIVLRDMEENANGFAVYGADWVTVWSTPLYYVLRGRQEWIPDVFAHEFTHIVSLKVNDWKSETSIVLFASGLVEDGVHNIDFGARVFLGFTMPYWWTEGMAEYGTHLAGFNWWTTSRDMHLRQAVLEDNALTYEEMFTPGNKDTGFDREKGYQQGYSMALYVMEKYGKEQYAQMAVNSDREGHLVWEKNIEDVLGIEGHKLYDGYMKWMRDRYDRQTAPIRKEEHLGGDLFITSRTDEAEIIEKLPDGRVKVELGRRKFKHSLFFDEDGVRDYIERRQGDIEKLKDETLKAEAREHLAEVESRLAGYLTAKEALPDEATVHDKVELARKYLLKSEGEARGAGGKKCLSDELNAEFDKADEKREKPTYEYWDKRQRKAHYEKGRGTWHMIPQVSPDGKYTAFAGRRGVGVVLMPIDINDFPVFSGRYLSSGWRSEIKEGIKLVPDSTVFNGYSFSPDGKKVIYSSLSCPDTWLPCHSWDLYRRYDLFVYDIETEEVEKLSERLRAILPAYSPDGQTIAFVHIEDGQNWLGLFPANAREVTIDGKCVIDGQPREKCIKWLVRKHDGTQVGQPSWSPDGGKLVFDLYRNHQQDVWMMNADGTDLHPLTWDRAEDRDGRFTPDGKHIIYSSDRTGIFNAYMMDLETREVKQLTNVIGGVYTPFLTRDGDLLYSYFRSYGLRIHGLKKEDFYNKVVDAGYEVTPEEVARNLAYQEALPEIREKSTSYNAFNPANWPPLDGYPLFIYERRGINIGAAIMAQDILCKHLAFGQVLLGETSDYRFFYINNMWYPQFFLGFVHVDFAGDFAQGWGSSELVSTRAEPHFEPPLSYKYRQSVDFGMAGISYDFGPIEMDAMYLYRYYTSINRTDTQNDAFLTNNSYTLALEYDGISPYATEGDINPQGRRLSLEYMLTRTGLPDKEFADVEWLGRRNPPGDHSDDYIYHELQFGYTEAIPIFWWNPDGKHTLEFHFRGGWQNRNVHRWDEFFAGSLHPLRYVPTQSTTHEFAGYEDFSLGGETMLVVGLAYRFPVYRHIDRKFGPFYFASVWGEIFGTAGNLWGYKAEFERDKYGNIRRHDESYWDPMVKPGTVEREVPFRDIATKNGNYMLYDIGFALKLKGYMFGYLYWNSFFRVAYGLNDIIGPYEVNDDRVWVDVYPNNPMYAETEPKSLRISIGIGSNFD